MAKKRRNKKLRSIILGVCLFFISVGFILAAVPYVLKSDHIRRYLIDMVCQTVDHFSYESIELNYLPFPQFVIKQVSLKQSQAFQAEAKTAIVRPKIIPLCWGQILFDRLELDQVHFDIYLRPGEDENQNQVAATKHYSLSRIMKIMQNDFGFLIGSRIKMRNTTATFSRGDGQFFDLENIQARLKPAKPRFDIEISGKSNYFNRFLFKGQFDTETATGIGRFELKQLDLESVSNRFFQEAPIKIGKSHLNLAFDFSVLKADHLEGQFEITYNNLPLYTDQARVELKGKRVTGNFNIKDQSYFLGLTHFDLTYPKLNITGNCLLDHDNSLVSFDLKAGALDVKSIRDTALSLFGHYSDVSDLFDVLRGGTIPALEIRAGQKRLEDLGLKNILISGQLSDGEIHIPDPALDLKHVSGEVVIENGILKGDGVTARLGRAEGQNGKLNVSISDIDAPFYLKVDIKTGLQELPETLIPLVGNDTFTEEMCRLEHIDGHATGQLVITDKNDELFTHVEVNELTLFADYERLPFALELRKGRLVYDDNNISLLDSWGSLGKTDFSNLTFNVDWKNETRLTITSLGAVFESDQVLPWLKSIESVRPHLSFLRSLKGKLIVDSLQFDGPVSQPENWQFDLSGRVQDLELDHRDIEFPLTLFSGRVTATPQALILSRIRAACLDAHLNISIESDGYGRAYEKNKALISGEVGPQVAARLEPKLEIPNDFAFKFPLILDHVEVNWTKVSDDIKVMGKVDVPAGPVIDFALLKTPEVFKIDHLHISDDASDAGFSLNMNETGTQFCYYGVLEKKSLDSILRTNRFLKGYIDGRFQVDLDPAHIEKMEATGHLSASDLIIPYHDKDIFIKEVTAKAADGQINLENMLVSRLSKEYRLSGKYNKAAENFPLTVDISASGLDWNTIEKEFLEEKAKDQNEITDRRPFGINTQINLKADFFESGKYILSPFFCDISLLENESIIDLSHVNLCGLSLPGRIQFRSNQNIVHIKPTAKNQPLDPLLDCLWQKKGLINGKYDFKGELLSDRLDIASPALQGKFSFNAGKGRIYRFGLLAKIISFLNVIELFKTKIPDWTKKGFAYNTISARGHIENGRLKFEEATLSSPSMDIVCQGEIDLVHNEMDMLFLVAPLKTVDLLVKYTPLVNDIFEGSLVTIPITAKGSLSDPRIKPLPSKEVRQELMDIMNRSFRLPGKIIQPWLDKSGGDNVE